MRSLFVLLLSALLLASGCIRPKEQIVTIAVTTDVHGMIFPYDFTNARPTDNSLAQVMTYVREQRSREDTLFFLLDNGDFLQGQPTVYYYNFIETEKSHLSVRAMNYMGYAAGTVGNHDIEAGPAVYNKVRETFSFPWLAANAIDTRTGEPYFEPYTILQAGSYRIAVLGLITPGVPHWLPKNLWPDMAFRDMVETASHWVSIIEKKEKPDALIGLFHSGTDPSYGGASEAYLNENATLLVARQVPGFDAVFAGHDHRVSIQKVANTEGDSVLVVDPGSHGRFAGELSLKLGPEGLESIEATNINMTGMDPDSDFMKTFEKDRLLVENYLGDTITWLAEEMRGMDAIFGPSSMMSLIHKVQLELAGAELSFTAPLSLNAVLEEGPLLVSDMFKLYRFENMLYTLKLSGKEIDGFLEHGVASWFATMNGPGDPMLLTRKNKPDQLAHPYYNFSSAAGVDYTVDLRRKPGDRVRIKAFSDGRTFSPADTFRVALNSYRGNGGGGHLTSGAGIPEDELSQRIVWSTDVDLRYYLMEELMARDTLHPRTENNWHCIPENWTKKAESRHREVF